MVPQGRRARFVGGAPGATGVREAGIGNPLASVAGGMLGAVVLGLTNLPRSDRTGMIVRRKDEGDDVD